MRSRKTKEGKTIGTRLFCAALCLLMVLSLGACGKSSVQESGSRPNGGEPSNNSGSGPKGGYAWKSRFQPLLSSSEDLSGLQPVLFTEEGFYAAVLQKLDHRAPTEGEREKYEGQFDVYGTALYFVSWDGKAEPLPNYKPSEPPDNAENRKGFFSSSDFGTLVMNSEKKLIGLESRSASWFTGPDELYGTDKQFDDIDYYQTEQSVEIFVLDTDGTELSRAAIPLDPEESGIDIFQAVACEDGNLLVLTYNSLVAVTPAGSIAWTLPCNDYLDALISLRDGTPAVLLYGEHGRELHPIDTKAKKLGEAYRIPSEAWSVFPGDESYDLYYTSGLYLYGYRLGEKTPDRILNWLSCDISTESLNNQSLHFAGNGIINGVISEDSGDTTSTLLFTLTRVPSDTVKEKRILTVAQLDSEPDLFLTTAMLRFNRSHEDVRLEYADYSQYNTENDDLGGLTKFNTEVMAGKTPDIIPTGMIPYSQYAAKGILEDLYPYIDADPELKREDFFTNLLKALEVGGGLYQMVPGFSVETLSGAASVVGDTPGWSYDDFYAALQRMPEDCSPLEPSATRDQVLNALLCVNMDSFVDWSAGKVNIDSDGFRQMLEFAAQFPEDYASEESGIYLNYSSQDLIRQGKQMLAQTYLYGLDSILLNDANFGGKATYIGWPSTEGVGSIMRIGNGFAMSRTCADKEAAWEFFRSMLTDQGQKEVHTIPSNRKAFDRLLKEYMTPVYMKDEYGNYLLDETGQKIQVSRGDWTDGVHVYNIYAMSQEQADEVLLVINTCDKVANFDNSIFDIVYAEAKGYFAGQKSMDDVVRVIQSKVNIFVNEQR